MIPSKTDEQVIKIDNNNTLGGELDEKILLQFKSDSLKVSLCAKIPFFFILKRGS